MVVRLVPLLSLLMTQACTAVTLLDREMLEPPGRVVPNLRYSPSPLAADRRSLDLYLPPGPGPHPVMIFVHGGYWIAGGRQQELGVYQRMGRRLANQGVIAAVISYRLAPSVQHPRQIEDVAEAIASVLDNVGAYGGDERKVFVMGHSAGAHLALLAGWDPRWLARHGHAPRELAGLIAISGPYDLEDLSTTPSGERVVPMVFGPKERWAAASPPSFVGKGRHPPTFMAIGVDDIPVLKRQGARLRDLALAAGDDLEWFEVGGRNHMTIVTRLFEGGDHLGDSILAFVISHSRR